VIRRRWIDSPRRLDHLELGMIHANPAPAQPRLAEDNELLAGGDHFLDVMQINQRQMSGWLNAFACGSCKVASKIFFQPPKRRRDVLITSPDKQIGTSLSSRGNSGN